MRPSEYRERRDNASIERECRIVLECDALWAIDPRKPDAYERLLQTVPAEVRLACFRMPMEACPIAVILMSSMGTTRPDVEFHSMEAIGHAYGVARQRIFQLELAGLDRLRESRDPAVMAWRATWRDHVRNNASAWDEMEVFHG